MTISPFVAAVICVLIMAAFVIPIEATSIAAFIGFDMHMASFMIGPATYSFGKNLVPGIDYFTQYSVGTPWLFSFFLAPTATATMVNAVWFVVAEILIFQLSLLFFLRWFLRSWSWALVVGLACLMLQFGTSSPLYAPSSTSARYPLLIICVMAFVHWIRRDSAWPATLLLAAALASAIFLNTETGIYICAAAAIVAVIMGPGFVVPVVRTVALGAATLVFFLVWNTIAFGPGVLQIQYLLLLLEPLMLYTGGLVALADRMARRLPLDLQCRLPGIALASVAWVAASVRLENPPCPRTHLAALAMVALVGLFMTAKYINMSIVGLWQVNAVCLLVVVAWWMRALLQQLPQQTKRLSSICIQNWFERGDLSARLAASGSRVWLGVAAIAVSLHDQGPTQSQSLRNPRLPDPSDRGELSLGGPERHPCGVPPGVHGHPVSPLDVELVDQAYKADGAGRAPGVPGLDHPHRSQTGFEVSFSAECRRLHRAAAEGFASGYRPYLPAALPRRHARHHQSRHGAEPASHAAEQLQGRRRNADTAGMAPDRQ